MELKTIFPHIGNRNVNTVQDNTGNSKAMKIFCNGEIKFYVDM
jgi:hypothetical protein